MSAIKQVTPAWPVVEIFGPTIQGEGVDQGVACAFVRFGGCDYRCDWCDTPHAVLPAEVRTNSQRLTALDIADRLAELSFDGQWIILSGGNPALHDLSTLIDVLHERGYFIAVETQGSRWREWMRDVDRLCVSPKPPSANEPKSKSSSLQKFLKEGMDARMSGDKPYEWMFLKVVCFTSEDVDYACLVRTQLSNALLYLSAGNDAGRTVSQPEREDPRSIGVVRNDICERYAWLVEEVLKRPQLQTHDVFVQCQAHVLVWGNQQGV